MILLSCQRDPDRWFDRGHHGDALAACRQCPLRQECAAEALACQATFGLWAGVWIDGCHDDAAPHLRAIADGTLVQSAAVAVAILDQHQNCGVNPSGHSPAAAPARRPYHRPGRSVKTAVLARSSGHCEVMADGCQFSFDRLVSRRATDTPGETSTAPAYFAACTNCADMVDRLEPKLAAAYGYTVDGGRDPAQVPLFWRSTRWVLLGRDGWLTELPVRTCEVAV